MGLLSRTAPSPPILPSQPYYSELTWTPVPSTQRAASTTTQTPSMRYSAPRRRTAQSPLLHTLAVSLCILLTLPTLCSAIDQQRLRRHRHHTAQQEGSGSGGSGSGQFDYLKQPPWWLPNPPEWGPIPPYVFTNYYHQPVTAAPVIPASVINEHNLPISSLFPYWMHPPSVVEGESPQKDFKAPPPVKEDESLPKWLKKPIWWTSQPGPHPFHALHAGQYNAATLPQPVYAPTSHPSMISHSVFTPMSQYPMWAQGPPGSLPQHNYWARAPAWPQQNPYIVGGHYPVPAVPPYMLSASPYDLPPPVAPAPSDKKESSKG